MNSKKIREEFLRFFEEKGHKIVPSSSLLPADPSVLFTTAGMQQFNPYYLGEKSPYGLNVVSCQKCIRTSDIDEVGDEKHLTFFEMLGNFSFGGYQKKEAITLSYEFIIKKLGLEIEKVTVFDPDKVEDRDWRKEVPKDQESYNIWEWEVGLPKEKIFLEGTENFWGPTGNEGPCGPTTEIYIKTKEGNIIEIWNIVFNEYFCNGEKRLKKLNLFGVDTGMGLERLATVIQEGNTVFETDLFLPIISEIEKLTQKEKNNKLFERASRIIADHTKAVVFIISEGILPSNVERGYVLRRILRRAIRYGRILSLPNNFLITLAQKVVEIYKDIYPEVKSRETDTLTAIQNEEEKFQETIKDGLKKAKKILNEKKPIISEVYSRIIQISTKDKNEAFRKIYKNRLVGKKEPNDFSNFSIKITDEEIYSATINGSEAFDLYQSYGFPIEMIVELAQEKRLFVDIESFREEVEKHKEISRAGVKNKFGGLGKEAGQESIKLHTATHLLHAALRQVLGTHVKQMGSDINPQRLRFDFTHSQKMTDEEIKKVEDIVNQKIEENFTIEKKEMDYSEALNSRALAFFKEKYPDKVSVYTIYNKKGDIFSREICAGPHVDSAGELGKFKIIKEESSGAGIRRIRAVLL